MKTLDINGTKLCVFTFEGQELFESSEISILLGYKQPSSLRKQTLNDWYALFDQGVDFRMFNDTPTLDAYKGLFYETHGRDPISASPSRGVLFFTATGLHKVFQKTSKSVPEDLRAVGSAKAPRDNSSSKDKPIELSKEDRLFEYQVLQTLLEQLERLQTPALRNLAITSAETALGRRLNELRTGETLSSIFTQTASPKSPQVISAPRSVPWGPLFVKEDYYSMTRIGEMAGGYSAKQAGFAADIVAKDLGYTRAQIRKEKLSINEVSMRPDTTTGQKRLMVRFHKDFANRIVQELRSNPEFEPIGGSPTITTFNGGDKQYPLLSRGPLDDQGPT